MVKVFLKFASNFRKYLHDFNFQKIYFLHINVIFDNHNDNIIYTVLLTNTVETHYLGYIPFDLTEKYC
jgi:hypothetical protein